VRNAIIDRVMIVALFKENKRVRFIV